MLDLAQKLLSLSQELLAHTENEAWDAAEETQQKRNQLVQELALKPVETLKKEESEQLSEMLLTCRALEQQSEVLLRNNSQQLAAQQKKISKGQAMQKAYGMHGRR